MIESKLTIDRYVYIVLLNWNGWRDTIECLESVFRLNYSKFTVIVCDNASADDSMDKIESWANGHILASCSNPDLSRLTVPPIPKPVAFISPTATGTVNKQPDSRLVLIQTGANLGFAGGNNVGINYALARGDLDYVWFNNDTVVEPDALCEMVQMAEANPKLGICGSLLRNYAFPQDILTAGGRRYNRWSGRTWSLKTLATAQLSTMPGAPDYIEGASMLISKRCLAEVGLLGEGYFLYFEELDMVARAKSMFSFGYAPASVVYHKEGASIGSSDIRKRRSAFAEFHQTRSRLVFTRKYYPWCLPSLLGAIAAGFFLRIFLGRLQNAIGIVRGVFAGLSSHPSNPDR